MEYPLIRRYKTKTEISKHVLILILMEYPLISYEKVSDFII